eukprot:tig00000681_g3145.t1
MRIIQGVDVNADALAGMGSVLLEAAWPAKASGLDEGRGPGLRLALVDLGYRSPVVHVLEGLGAQVQVQGPAGSLAADAPTYAGDEKPTLEHRVGGWEEGKMPALQPAEEATAPRFDLVSQTYVSAPAPFRGPFYLLAELRLAAFGAYDRAAGRPLYSASVDGLALTLARPDEHLFSAAQVVQTRFVSGARHAVCLVGPGGASAVERGPAVVDGSRPFLARCFRALRNPRAASFEVGLEASQPVRNLGHRLLSIALYYSVRGAPLASVSCRLIETTYGAAGFHEADVAVSPADGAAGAPRLDAGFGPGEVAVWRHFVAAAVDDNADDDDERLVKASVISAGGVSSGSSSSSAAAPHWASNSAALVDAKNEYRYYRTVEGEGTWRYECWTGLDRRVRDLVLRERGGRWPFGRAPLEHRALLLSTTHLCADGFSLPAPPPAALVPTEHPQEVDVDSWLTEAYGLPPLGWDRASDAIQQRLTIWYYAVPIPAGQAPRGTPRVLEKLGGPLTSIITIVVPLRGSALRDPASQGDPAWQQGSGSGRRYIPGSTGHVDARDQAWFDSSYDRLLDLARFQMPHQIQVAGLVQPSRWEIVVYFMLTAPGGRQPLYPRRLPRPPQ